jgi:hypothetical protein
MTKDMRNGLASTCYGVVLAGVGGGLYVVDIDAVSTIGALVLGGGVLLALFGLLAVGRAFRAD